MADATVTTTVYVNGEPYTDADGWPVDGTQFSTNHEVIFAEGTGDVEVRFYVWTASP